MLEWLKRLHNLERLNIAHNQGTNGLPLIDTVFDIDLPVLEQEVVEVAVQFWLGNFCLGNTVSWEVELGQ